MRGTTAERARRAGALVLLGAVAGCAAAGAGKACTEIGVPTGVSLDVAPEDASGVHAAEMEVCWDGECREPGVSLEDSRESADQGCDDGACSAKAVPTGGKHAFASLDGLPRPGGGARQAPRRGRGGAVRRHGRRHTGDGAGQRPRLRRGRPAGRSTDRRRRPAGALILLRSPRRARKRGAWELCPGCGRAKEPGAPCGYRLGLSSGAGGGREPGGGGGGGCALILLAAAALPAALDTALTLAQG